MDLKRCVPACNSRVLTVVAPARDTSRGYGVESERREYLWSMAKRTEDAIDVLLSSPARQRSHRCQRCCSGPYFGPRLARWIPWVEDWRRRRSRDSKAWVKSRRDANRWLAREALFPGGLAYRLARPWSSECTWKYLCVCTVYLVEYIGRIPR